ncbi:uncharacterized protein N7459_007735 [Penicillium hispanicum]|uniref:uncharacterized protein n=1 Tax=Penicillium hispanicum TaxID=1080232 RepID=UPI002540D03E|nr:uncharacterized protein N7459_007735 [Penicillium hispanicum]KAJ5578771.1 hypothetical protein N7459_007735 [Penicillium hispanicum]
MERTRNAQTSATPERFIVEADRTRSPVSHDNTTSIKSPQQVQIQQLLQELPKRLRRRQLPSSLKLKKTPGGCCDLHRALNIDVITNIFHLVQQEITTNFRQLDAYPELVGPIEAQILVNLRALKGMWTRPTMNHPVAPGAWPYQINGCAACILARIASHRDIIRDLRVVLQSRTRTRKKHRPCQLMMFVDECINQFGADDAAELYGTASQLAFGMKNNRKACVKRWVRDPTHPKRKHHGRRPRQGPRSNEQPVLRTSIVETPRAAAAGPSNFFQHHDNSISVYRESWVEPVSSSSRTSFPGDRARRSGVPTPEPSKPDSYPRRHSRHQPQPQPPDQPFGDLSKEIDEVIELYKRLGNGNPFSRDEFVPEAMVVPLRIRKNEPVPDLPQRDTVVVPLVYEYSDSDYFTSDWTDDSCDEADSQAFAARPLPAATTWSLLCDQGNVI